MSFINAGQSLTGNMALNSNWTHSPDLCRVFIKLLMD